MANKCLSVKKNLQTKSIKCDIQCARCTIEEESTNYVFFECPLVVQTWAFSKIP